MTARHAPGTASGDGDAGPRAGFTDTVTVQGLVLVTVYRADGSLHRVQAGNITTDPGDAYLAARIAAGIGPAAPADAVAKVAGMKLGRATTTPTKTGAGAVLGSYVTGSNRAFDTGYPQVAALGAGLGTNVVHRCTWPVGAVTGVIGEAVLITDATVNAASAAAATYCRVVYTPITIAAGEQVVVSWAQKFLG